jgi:hypothetical protein
LATDKTCKWMKTNPGRFAPMTCSPRKVSRLVPLNRYYIIIDEVFFDNFFIIIYLLVVYNKIIIHSFWSTFVKDLKRTLLAKFTKKQTRTIKSFTILTFDAQFIKKEVMCALVQHLSHFMHF